MKDDEYEKMTQLLDKRKHKDSAMKRWGKEKSVAQSTRQSTLPPSSYVSSTGLHGKRTLNESETAYGNLLIYRA